MKEFNLRISTPEGDVFNGSAIFLSLRGAEGDLAVMAGHVPFITTVKAGNCKVETPNEADSFSGTVPGGLLIVDHDQVTLICGSFSEEESN
ncbi:MAG: hypothetical protein PUC27_07440 [Clostridium sp.]|nr:hypothetical protein [Clostridium sp.]